MVEQQKSYEHVLTYLEDALRDGKLTLGQSLPPERELAEQLGISRNSVREAVRLLEHMGFLVSSQGAGNFISCNIQRNLQDSFDMLILLQQIDYHQLAELRSGLELQAALLAQLRLKRLSSTLFWHPSVTLRWLLSRLLRKLWVWV